MHPGIALLLFLLFAFATLGGVLAVVALVRVSAVEHLRRRVLRLEQTLAELNERLAKTETEPAPAAPASGQGEMVEEIPEVVPAQPLRPAAEPVVPDYKRWESLLGRRGLGWVAAVLLLFAAGFFLQHAFEQGWIDELGRVTLGIAVGLSLCAGGLRCHFKKWRVFSQILTSVGVMLLYLCTYAAFGFYDLIPQQSAGIFLAILVALSTALAVLYDALSIAVMAVVGGLLTPLLLHSAYDQYISLFLYLAVLNAGVVVLAVYRRWPAFATISLIGTQGVYWLWYAENYHPEKWGAALTFQIVLFALYVGRLCLAQGWRRRRATIEDLARIPVNCLLFVIAGWVLLEADYHDWLGSLFSLLATGYLALGWWRRQECQKAAFLLVVAVAMGLAAVVPPLEFDADWVAVGWIVPALALWWFGLRSNSIPLRYFGVAFGALAVIRLVFVDTVTAHTEPFVPIFNAYALPALVTVAGVFFVTWIAQRFSPGLMEIDKVVIWSAGIGGLVLLWMILSVETFQYFHTQIRAQARVVEAWTGRAGDFYIEFPDDNYSKTFDHVKEVREREVLDEQGRSIIERQRNQARVLSRLAQTWLSIVWSLYGAALLAIGFIFRIAVLRWSALVLFAITLLKVVMVDMAELSAIYRVATFLALALAMGAGAWVYQRFFLDDDSSGEQADDNQNADD